MTVEVIFLLQNLFGHTIDYSELATWDSSQKLSFRVFGWRGDRARLVRTGGGLLAFRAPHPEGGVDFILQWEELCRDCRAGLSNVFHFSQPATQGQDSY